jgi:hypothetical protein
MKITLEIPEYTGDDLKSHWENGFEISVSNTNNQLIIQANKAGLISLATQLLTLAQNEVPINHHFHYDENNSLETGSAELIIEKMQSLSPVQVPTLE